jgi:hypothetical protein
MRNFRCFFINGDDTVRTFEALEVDNEAEAIVRAREMLRSQSLAASAELWESGHLITRIPRDTEKDRT